MSVTKKSGLIKSYVFPEEKEEVIALSKKTHLSVSELVRRLILGKKLPDASRHESVLNLMKINADQARLGNLLKMALNDEDFVYPDNMDLESLHDRILETQTSLKNKIKEL